MAKQNDTPAEKEAETPQAAPQAPKAPRLDSGPKVDEKNGAHLPATYRVSPNVIRQDF